MLIIKQSSFSLPTTKIMENTEYIRRPDKDQFRNDGRPIPIKISSHVSTRDAVECRAWHSDPPRGGRPTYAIIAYDKAIYTRYRSPAVKQLADRLRAIPFPMQPDHRRHWLRQWLPSGDGSNMGARLRIVGDAGKEATQLNGGGQLALLLEDGADRGSSGFGDQEHGQKVERHP
jgi:hypothetical protein